MKVNHIENEEITDYTEFVLTAENFGFVVSVSKKFYGERKF
jgi:hypothetical protein